MNKSLPRLRDPFVSPSQRRVDLLCDTCESFVANPPRDPVDRKAFADLVLRQLRLVDTPGRAQAARLISSSREVPRQVVLRFANDTITVAEPVLALSPALGELDLISVIAVTSRDHHMAIASRADLTSRVVSSLFLIPSGGIFLALAKNSAAEFDGAQKGILLSAALKDSQLASALLNRGDIEHTVLAPAFFMVSSAGRRSILSAIAAGPSDPGEMVAPGGLPASPHLETITEAYLSDNPEPAVEILEGELRVSESIALAMLTDPSPEPFAMAMKMLGASAETFSAAILKSGGEVSRSTRRFEQLMRLYDWLEPATVSRLLRIFRGPSRPRIDFRYAPQTEDVPRAQDRLQPRGIPSKVPDRLRTFGRG